MSTSKTTSSQADPHRNERMSQCVYNPTKGPSIRLAQNKCSTTITDLLQNLQENGLHTITDGLIGEWRAPLPMHDLSQATTYAQALLNVQTILVERLGHIYMLLETWQLSIATTYNPPMSAM